MLHRARFKNVSTFDRGIFIFEKLVFFHSSIRRETEQKLFATISQKLIKLHINYIIITSTKSSVQ